MDESPCRIDVDEGETLLREDLVDGLRVIPPRVVLGGGRRLFGDGAVPRAWRLVASTTMPAGAVAGVLDRGGEPRAEVSSLDSTPVTY